MPSKKTSNRIVVWAVLAMLVLFVGIVAFVGSRGDSVANATPPSRSTGSVTLHRPALRTDSPDSRAAAGARGPEPAPELIRDARPRMLAAHPDVAQFRTLEHKVLRSKDEQQKRKALLSDAAALRNARDRLLADRNSLTRADELERLYRVEYLAAAIEDPSNPALSDALDAIKDVVLADNIHKMAPVDLQRSLAGDKVELYMALLHDSPDRAAAISHEAQGTPLEPLLRYAGQRYRMWTSADTGMVQ
jgi:hypothetical protein